MKFQSICCIRSAMVIIAANTVCCSVSATAPNVDAGSALNQSEQELKSTKPVLQFQAPATKPEITPAANEQTVFINRFEFKGNSLLTSEFLNEATASFTNRSLSLKQLKEVADLVMTTYRQSGWTVRAYLPKQEIENGIVTIQVVESQFGGVAFSGEIPKRVEATRLIEVAESNLTKGKPLNAKQLDRVLLLLDDLPGVSVSGHLVPGELEGETNLIITANDTPLFTGNASLDSHGSRTTGSERISVNMNVNSPLHKGDLLGMNGIKTQGSEYYRMSYSLPIGYDGWRAGLHASSLYYRVITSEFSTLNANGIATTQGWDISYPVMRSQLQNVNLALSYDDKNFRNSSGTSTTTYNIKSYSASINAGFIDTWAGGGVTNSNISVTEGDNSADSHYNKLLLSLSRLQSLSESLSLFFSATGQTTNANLDSSEKMYLGGVAGVRAYPTSEAGGSQAHIFTFELRKQLFENIAITGFYDYGHVKVNLDNSITSAANPNDYSLQGYGATLDWKANQSIDIKLTLAQRIGSNPAANTSTGMDSDGTKTQTRAWLSLNMAF